MVVKSTSSDTRFQCKNPEISVKMCQILLVWFERLILDTFFVIYWDSSEPFPQRNGPKFDLLSTLYKFSGYAEYWHKQLAFQSISIRAFEWQRRWWPLFLTFSLFLLFFSVVYFSHTRSARIKTTYLEKVDQRTHKT